MADINGTSNSGDLPQSAGSGATGTGTGTGTGGFGQTAGTSGSLKGSTPGRHDADTLRPAGGSTTVQPTHSEAHSYNEARSTYQPERTGTEVVVTERRSASRPSRNMVIGSAVAGAIAGGALPFMLAGRKSGGGRIEVDATRKSAGKGGVEVDASRSSDVSANNDHDPSVSRSSSRRRS
jgi:hypothetical protein